MSLPVAQPPTQTAPLGETQNGKLVNLFSSVWQQWLTTLWTNVRSPAGTAVPINSTALGVPGQFAYDQNFLYVCVGQRQWKRIALTAF